MQRSEMPESKSTRDQQASAGRRARLERRTPLLALGVVLLVFFVALGSSRSLAHVGGPGNLTRERLIVGNVIFLLVAVTVIPALLYVIWQSLGRIGDETGPGGRESSEKKMFKLVLALALVGGTLAALANLGPSRAPAPRAPVGQVKKIFTADNTESKQTAETLAPWVASAAGIALLLAAAWVARRRTQRAQLSADELDSPRSDLRELVGISIAEIERETDPRRAVIRAYTGMESTLARHDLGRRPFEAPGEYLSRAFAAIRLSRHPGKRLTELFERARFSEHAIGPEMKQESIAALAELRDELEAKPR